MNPTCHTHLRVPKRSNSVDCTAAAHGQHTHTVGVHSLSAAVSARYMTSTRTCTTRWETLRRRSAILPAAPPPSLPWHSYHIVTNMYESTNTTRWATFSMHLQVQPEERSRTEPKLDTSTHHNPKPFNSWPIILAWLFRRIRQESLFSKLCHFCLDQLHTDTVHNSRHLRRGSVFRKSLRRKARIRTRRTEVQVQLLQPHLHTTDFSANSRSNS